MNIKDLQAGTYNEIAPVAPAAPTLNINDLPSDQVGEVGQPKTYSFKNYDANIKENLNQQTTDYGNLISDYKAGKMGIGSLITQAVGSTAKNTSAVLGTAVKTLLPQSVVDYGAEHIVPAIGKGIKKVQGGVESVIENTPLNSVVNSDLANKAADVLDAHPNIQKNAEAVLDTTNLALTPLTAGESGVVTKAVATGVAKNTARLTKAAAGKVTEKAVEKFAKTGVADKVVKAAEKTTRNYNEQVLNLDANTRRLENSYRKDGKPSIGDILSERDIKLTTRNEPSTGRTVLDADDAIDGINDEIRLHSGVKRELLKHEDHTVHINDIEDGVVKKILADTTMDPTVKEQAVDYFRKWYSAKQKMYEAEPNLTLDKADQIRQWADDLVDFKKHRVTNTPIEKGQEVAGLATRRYIDSLVKENAKDTGLQAMNSDIQDLIRARDILQKRNGQMIAKGGVASGLIRRAVGLGIGSSIGGNGVGGIMGAIIGARSADEIANLLRETPKAILTRVAKQVTKNNPEKQSIFDDAMEILDRKKYARATQKRLPAPGQTSNKVYVSPTGAAANDIRKAKIGERANLQNKADDRSFNTNKKQYEKGPDPTKMLPPGKFDRAGRPINENVRPVIKVQPTKAKDIARGFNEDVVKNRKNVLAARRKEARERRMSKRKKS